MTGADFLVTTVVTILIFLMSTLPPLVSIFFIPYNEHNMDLLIVTLNIGC